MFFLNVLLNFDSFQFFYQKKLQFNTVKKRESILMNKNEHKINTINNLKVVKFQKIFVLKIIRELIRYFIPN